MNPAVRLDELLGRQAHALGRRLGPTVIFRRTMHRYVDDRSSMEIVRRVSAPNRLRDDVTVDGAWRFSEAFDGTRAWYRDANHLMPAEATGRALAAHRWEGARLDHLTSLASSKRLGCVLRNLGIQSTVRGRRLPAIQISMGDFAETVFIDEHGRIAAHHWDVPEAGDDEQELEVCIDEWDRCDGLVYPIRSTVLDRRTTRTVADIAIEEASFEPYSVDVFNLCAD